MNNIVLVGFMGTGKTAVARLLAKETGMEYVSVDDVIEKKEGRSIKDIFRDNGEDYFREKEREAVCDVTGRSDQVIDTGGGVVLDERNMERLRGTGLVICLWADVDSIYERTRRHGHRPLLNVPDPRSSIRDLLSYRKPFYEKADEHVDTTGLSPEQVKDRIKVIISGSEKKTQQ